MTGRFTALWFAILAALLIGVSSPAAAQETSGEYREALNGIHAEMNALTLEIENFRINSRYCKPPQIPTKAEAQAALDELAKRAEALNRRYNALKQSLKDFARNPRVAAELMLRDIDPTQDRWFSSYEAARRRMLDALARKRAALAAAPELDCSPKPKPQPVVAVPTFQPPALPVRPSVDASGWPALPSHFCSWDEYWKFINDVINPLYLKAAEDAERVAKFRSEVEQAVNRYVQAGRPVPAELLARRRQAIADVEQANRRMRESEDLRNRAKAIPVIDCRQPQQEPPRAEPPPKPPTEPQWSRGLDQLDNFAVSLQERIIDDVEADFKELEEMARRRGACDDLFDFADDIDFGLDELEDSKKFPPEMIREWRARLDDIMDRCPVPMHLLPRMPPRPVLGLPPPNPAAARMLDIHNKERAQFRLPPLQWDVRLAANAAAYAQRLADGQPYEHASRTGRETERENLSMGYLTATAEGLMQKWLSEKRNLKIGGIFPDISLTGNWKDAGHYSQMIWSTTTHVGCGTAKGKWAYLVCRYSPPGNQDGQPVIANQGDIAPPNSSTPTIPRLDPRDMPRVGGGMTQIDPPPPPPPTARDDAPEGKEENHPLVRYAQEADAAHAKETDCGNAAMARLELEKMRYALDELKKRLKAARQAGPFSNVKPADVQRQIDDLQRRIREAEERRPRPPGTCPPGGQPPPTPPPRQPH